MNGDLFKLSIIIYEFLYLLFFQVIWLVSFLAVIILDVTWGLAVAVGFALLTVVLRSQWFVVAKVYRPMHNRSYFAYF